VVDQGVGEPGEALAVHAGSRRDKVGARRRNRWA
jgi:hypothetical protein